MYANSWMIIGAQRAGFFRLAERCMTYFLRYENPKTGAFQSGAIYLVQAGNAWLLAGMPAESVVALTNAIKLAPTDGEVRKDRGRAYVALKKWEELIRRQLLQSSEEKRAV